MNKCVYCEVECTKYYCDFCDKFVQKLKNSHPCKLTDEDRVLLEKHKENIAKNKTMINLDIKEE